MFFKQIHRLCLALCLLGLSFAFTSAYSYSDKIVAIVNDDVITQSELNKRIDEQKQQMLHANIPLPSEKELRHKVLDNLIDREMILQIASRNKFKVADKDVDEAIATVAKHNNATIAQLQEELQKMGIKFKDYRKNIAEEITIHRIQQQAVMGKVTVTDQEIASYMHKANTKDDARQMALQHKFEEVLQVWMQQLRSTAYVKIMEDN